MNALLWTLQIILGLYFIGVGLIHFVVPSGLPTLMSWMYELSPNLHQFSGTAELLGGLGLILPGLTKIKPNLTVYAAEGLVLVMVGASILHIQRDEYANMGFNIILMLLVGFVAYGRWKLSPLKENGE